VFKIKKKTLLGKISVLKSLVIPKIIHKASYLPNIYLLNWWNFRLMPTFRQPILAGFVRANRLAANKNTKDN